MLEAAGGALFPRPVPNYTEYRYAVVNDRRVLVEPKTRKIIKIID
jgi:hypothetical protein